MSDDIIDLKDVLERVQDDKELLVELFEIFEGEFEIKRKALVEAINVNDIKSIKEIAHSLKGSSGNISAKLMHAECLKLELLAKDGKTDGMMDLVSVIDGYFERVKVFAQEFKKEVQG